MPRALGDAEVPTSPFGPLLARQARQHEVRHRTREPTLLLGLGRTPFSRLPFGFCCRFGKSGEHHFHDRVDDGDELVGDLGLLLSLRSYPLHADVLAGFDRDSNETVRRPFFFGSAEVPIRHLEETLP